MRKIIVTEFITLDGVVEAPGGDETRHPQGGWQMAYQHPESGKYKVEELASVEALLMGRKTYDVFSHFWPTQNDPGFGEPINRLPKYVVSTTLQSADWNNCHILRDGTKDVADLKKTEGGDILVYGSATLVRSLFQNDLVDELRLIMYPVSIGGGQRIFDENREIKKFTLRSSRVLDNGALILEYLPQK